MVDLNKCKQLMSERDRHLLRDEDANRLTMLGLADAVPDLVAEVERLQHMLSMKPDITPPVRGEAIEQFQRLWEACVGLSDKADFKAVLQYVSRLEEHIKHLEGRAS